MEVITNAERMIKEDMAEYILEELSRYDCIPDGKKNNCNECNNKGID